MQTDHDSNLMSSPKQKVSFAVLGPPPSLFPCQMMIPGFSMPLSINWSIKRRDMVPRIYEMASDQRYYCKEVHPLFTCNSSALTIRQTVCKLIRHSLQFSKQHLVKLFNLYSITEDTSPQINTAAVYHLHDRQ